MDDVKWLFEVFFYLSKEGIFDKFVGNGHGFFSVVGMVGGVLHEAVHDMAAFRTYGFVIDAWYRQIHEGCPTDSAYLRLVVNVDQLLH